MTASGAELGSVPISVQVRVLWGDVGVGQTNGMDG
jgi:hypothetical protein